VACRPFEGGDQEEVSQQLIEVVWGDIVVSVTADGNVSLPWHREVTFGTSGTVAEVNVEQGDRVTEGQVLASLDAATLEQAIKTAERAVQTAELGVQTAETGVKTGESAVKSAEIDLEQATNDYQELTAPYPYVTYEFVLPESVNSIRLAELRIKVAQEEFQKGIKGEQYSMARVNERLSEAQEILAEAESKLAWGFGGGIQPSNIDYWTLRAAQLKVEKAQLALGEAKNSLDKAQIAVYKAKNDLDKAQNDLDEANDKLEKAVIFAAFDGVIAKVNVNEGDVLSSVDYATKTIIELIDPTSMELKVGVDEIDIPSVKPNQRAIIEVDALPALQLEGKVTFICPLSTVESGIVLYDVTIGFDVPEGCELKAGMSATADIIINERSNVLLVPDRAIKHDSQGNPVVGVMVDERVQERPVVIGISDGYEAEIVSGLQEGETVVTEFQPTTTPTSSRPGGFLFH